MNDNFSELDCTCIVCKSFNQESNNKLMECSACQNLYHQVSPEVQKEWSAIISMPHETCVFLDYHH